MTKADFERKRKTSSAYFETEIKKITAAIVKKYNPEHKSLSDELITLRQEESENA